MVNIKYRLLSVLLGYAPDRNARNKCYTLIIKADYAGKSQREVDIMLVNLLSDGLNYDKWPWTEQEPNPYDGYTSPGEVN